MSKIKYQPPLEELTTRLGPGTKLKISALKPSFSYTEYLQQSILMGFTGLSRDGTAIAAEHKNKITKKNRRRSERGFSNQPGSSC